MLGVLALTVAIVAQGAVPLRASAQSNAHRQATLTAGDWLEVRGESRGYLQVYDHRRERPGYVRRSAVRVHGLDESTAPPLLAVVEHLRDGSREESLGIGYAALYLKVAPARDIGPRIFDALGTMAARLAARASSRVAGPSDGSLAQEIEVAESYGVHFARFEREGQTKVCYDGDAFRRVIALGGQGEMRVRAALGLTDPGCLDPAQVPSLSLANLTFQAEVLHAIDESTLSQVSASDRAALRVRRATTQATLAYFAARTGDLGLARSASERATNSLQLVERTELDDDNRFFYEEAALRVASVRWAQGEVPGVERPIRVEWARGEPGQTCLRIRGRQDPKPASFEHCTYGVVWPASLRIAPDGRAVTASVSLLPGYTELMILRLGASGWSADSVPPAELDPSLGYAELAGFSADGSEMLVAREARASGPLGSPNSLAPWIEKNYRVLSTRTLRLVRQAKKLSELGRTRVVPSAEWRQGAIALR